MKKQINYNALVAEVKRRGFKNSGTKTVKQLKTIIKRDLYANNNYGQILRAMRS